MTIDMELLGSKFAMAIANRENRITRILELKKSLLGYCSVDDKMKIVVVDHVGFTKARNLIEDLTAKNIEINRQIDAAELLLNATGYAGPGDIRRRINELNSELYKLGARYQNSKIPEEVVLWKQHRHNLELINKIRGEITDLESLLNKLKVAAPELV